MPAFGGYVDDLFKAASRATRKGRAAGRVVSNTTKALARRESAVMKSSSPVGMRGSASERLAAKRRLQASAAKRISTAEAQMVKSGRATVATGIGAGSATMLMSEKKRGGMGSYRPPMPMTRGPVGSGRFA